MKSILSGTRGFEVTDTAGAKVYMNKDLIIGITDTSPKCKVAYLSGETSYIYVQESYEEVIKLFES
jgi:hypothetical protein